MKKILLLLLMTTSLAHAKNTGEWDFIDDPTKEWFKTLRNSQGFVCCSISDGHAAVWRRDGNGFEVLLNNKWVKVPDETVLKRTPNKVGQAVVWYSLAYEIRCFLPENET